MTGIEILSLVLANAPAAIRTIGELKTLIADGFKEFDGSFSDDTPIEEARAQVLAAMDEIARQSAEIQGIE